LIIRIWGGLKATDDKIGRDRVTTLGLSSRGKRTGGFRPPQEKTLERRGDPKGFQDTLTLEPAVSGGGENRFVDSFGQTREKKSQRPREMSRVTRARGTQGTQTVNGCPSVWVVQKRGGMVLNRMSIIHLG